MIGAEADTTYQTLMMTMIPPIKTMTMSMNPPEEDKKVMALLMIMNMIHKGIIVIVISMI